MSICQFPHAPKPSWVSAREEIGISTSTSDLTGTVRITGNQTHADTGKSSGFERSQYASVAITLSKNLYDGGQTVEKTKLARYKLVTRQFCFFDSLPTIIEIFAQRNGD